MAFKKKNTTEEVVETEEIIEDEIVEDIPETTTEVIEEEEPTEEVVEKLPAGTYLVKQNIKKNGRVYSIGEKIHFEEETEEVKSLISDGIIF